MVTHATAEGYKAALPSRYTTIGFVRANPPCRSSSFAAGFIHRCAIRRRSSSSPMQPAYQEQ